MLVNCICRFRWNSEWKGKHKQNHTSKTHWTIWTGDTFVIISKTIGSRWMNWNVEFFFAFNAPEYDSSVLVTNQSCNVSKSSIVVLGYLIPLSRTHFICEFMRLMYSKPTENLVAFRKMGLPLRMKRNSVDVFVVCIQPNSIENIIHRFSKEMLIATATVLYIVYWFFFRSLFSSFQLCVSLYHSFCICITAIVCPIHVRQALSTSV